MLTTTGGSVVFVYNLINVPIIKTLITWGSTGMTYELMLSQRVVRDTPVKTGENSLEDHLGGYE